MSVDGFYVGDLPGESKTYTYPWSPQPWTWQPTITVASTTTTPSTKVIEAAEDKDGGYYSVLVDRVEKARCFDVDTLIKLAIMFSRED